MEGVAGILAAILKYGWLFFSGICMALFTWLFKKANDTYSKSETERLMDLKMEPLKQSVDRLTYTIERSAEATEKLNASINILHTDVAVIKHQVSEVKGK